MHTGVRAHIWIVKSSGITLLFKKKKNKEKKKTPKKTLCSIYTAEIINNVPPAADTTQQRMDYLLLPELKEVGQLFVLSRAVTSHQK